MPQLILFNKPFQVLSQFTDDSGRQTLADYISIKNVFPAGRLDYDSEGLLLLTDHGPLQHQISHPKHKLEKTYWAQVEGDITDKAIKALSQGVELNDGPTRPAKVRKIPEPSLWQRDPPIRFRAAIPTSWVELKISEGRNRQVRRMTASVGFPTLRLVRVAIGDWKVGDIPLGEYRVLNIAAPAAPANPPRKTVRKRK